jgi:hypothetical protein
MVENEVQAESQSTDARGGTQDHVGLSAALAQGLESLARGWLSIVRPMDRRVHVDFLALRLVVDGRGSQLVAPWPWDAWP